MQINLFRNGFWWLSFPLGFIVSTTAFAAPTQVHNTGKYSFKGGLLIFRGNGPRLYLLKNYSSKSILINRKIRNNPGASAGWASTISPGKWSALMLNRHSFMMYCMLINNQHYRNVNCRHALTVKVIKNFQAKRPSTIKNSYWIAENKSYNQLLKSIRMRGIKF